MNARRLDRLDALHARLYCWRWRVRAVITVLLMIWVYLAVPARMMTMPPQPPNPMAAYEAVNVPPPQEDHTAELTAPLKRIPLAKCPPMPMSSPIGQRWVRQIDDHRATRYSEGEFIPGCWEFTPGCWVGAEVPAGPEAILTGPWSPRTRYVLAHYVRYLRSPAMQDFLRQVTLLAQKPFALPMDMADSRGDPLNSTLILLAAQARYQIAQQGDVSSAAGTIQAILKLAAGIEDDATLPRLGTAQSLRQVALTEVAYWCQEYPISREQAGILRRMLDRNHFDLRAAWKTTMQGQYVLLQRAMDSCYTQGPHGWCVVHRFNPSATADRAWCVLNLASWMMTDRQHMIERLRQFRDEACRRADLPYEEACKGMGGMGLSDVSPCPVDGPLLASGADGSVAMSLMFRECLKTLRMELGVRTALALSTYRHEQQQYPDGLAQLVPEYLPALPLDPLYNRPLGYQKQSETDFFLYALEHDKIYPASASKQEYIEPWDVLLAGPRPQPPFELYLRPYPDWRAHDER